jgi:hypothetical protein
MSFLTRVCQNHGALLPNIGEIDPVVHMRKVSSPPFLRVIGTRSWKVTTPEITLASPVILSSVVALIGDFADWRTRVVQSDLRGTGDASPELTRQFCHRKIVATMDSNSRSSSFSISFALKRVASSARFWKSP